MQTIENMLDLADSHPVVMGILNATPDSFSDGGKFVRPEIAVARAREMLAQGADIIDIGAESTRPGAERVAASDQIDRLAEILPAVCELGAIVSIDTTRARVAEFALQAGAKIINDISAGEEDPEILALAGALGSPICLMHKKGSPDSMQKNPEYFDVVSEVARYLELRVESAMQAGVDREKCIVDPGIGFGKTLAHNLELIKHTARFAKIAGPVLMGTSRKRFIGEIANEPVPENRLGGTIASNLYALGEGAKIFRVHDVKQTRQALDVFCRIADA